MSIYLDYNATTPIDKSVSEIIFTTLTKFWGNPSSSYDIGKDASSVIRDARLKVANMISCSCDEIIFTSGGTESNHMIIHTAVKAYQSYCHSNGFNSVNSNPHIITTNIEHDSVKLPLEVLATNKEIDVTFVPVSKSTGAIVVNDIINAIRPNTCLITVMLANNETGVIQPLKLLCEKVRKFEGTSNRKIYVHSDAAQAIGKIPVDVQDLGIDYLTIVGHKFYGPRIGAIYYKQGSPLHPVFYGGGQERNFRPGTENTCMIAGLGRAAELVSKNIESYEKTMKDVCNYLRESLIAAFADKVIFNVKPDVDKLPNTLSVAFNFKHLTGSELLKEAKEIYASTGAACHSDSDVSSVLLSSGVPKDLVCKTLRLSIGRETSKQDIDKAIQCLMMTIKQHNKE